MRIGIKLFSATTSYSGMFNYIIWDIIIIFLIMFHEYLLIVSGLLNKNESDIESISGAYDRIWKCNANQDNNFYLNKFFKNQIQSFKLNEEFSFSEEDKKEEEEEMGFFKGLMKRFFPTIRVYILYLRCFRMKNLERIFMFTLL